MTPVHPYANPLAANPLRTRADLQTAVRALVHPILPHVSEGGARVRLGGFAAWFSRADAELEGFARPLWGLAPLAAGGGRFDHWDVWRRGLAAGTAPGHPERWEVYDGTQQTMVEQAAIGFGLLLAPHELWEPLPAGVRERLVAWLSLINRHEPFASNWHFFRVVVNLGLERVGAPTDEAAVARSLDVIDTYYLGDGWYEDGTGGHRDHYIGWAFHVYGLVYAAARPNDARSRTFRERAHAFAQEFQHWFDPEGGVIPFGRSLTYRFAAASFWGALALVGEEALPWGRIKGLALRHLRWWTHWPISDRDGVLSIGWTYANPWMRERYNSAGSPYWALKAFLPLALAEDHPFWRAAETPQPAPAGPSAQPHPGMLLGRDATQAVALSGGHDAATGYNQGAAKYARFAYSSRFGFSGDVPDPYGFGPGPGDSMLTFVAADGRHCGRRRVEACELVGDMLYSRWRAWPDVLVHTVLAGGAPWHVRVHRIETPRPLETREGGFALGCPDVADFDARMDGGRAVATSAFGLSGIQDADGRRAALVLPQGPNANVMHPYAVVPLLAGSVPEGTHECACIVMATDQPEAVNWDAPAASLDAALRVLRTLADAPATGAA